MRPPGPRRRAGAGYDRMRRRILDAHGWRCARCGRAGRLELHHVTPIDKGGEDIESNLQPLCRPCHFEIHARKPGPDRSAWRAELARMLGG